MMASESGGIENRPTVSGNEANQLVNQEQTDLHTVSSAIEVLIKGKFYVRVCRRERLFSLFRQLDCNSKLYINLICR